MNRLILIGLCFFLASCTDSDVAIDSNYASQVIGTGITTGMTANEIKAFLSKYDDKFQLYNLCIKEPEAKSTPCPAGYSAIGSIQLPSDNYWIGKGQAQIYLTFNENLELTANFYEIYYENENH